MTSALRYLNKNPLSNMDIIVPIDRGSVSFIYSDDDGVCFLENKSGAYMMSVSNREAGIKILNLLPDKGLFSFHQSYMLNDFKLKVAYTTFLENYQAVYFSKGYLPIKNYLAIRPLDVSHIKTIIANYEIDIGKKYILDRIECRELFGGFIDNSLVGFIGIHAEGSIGMLKVFDNYKRKGYGEALSRYMVNHQLCNDVVPYEQIGINNTASLLLAQKLGFTISTEKVYWLF